MKDTLILYQKYVDLIDYVYVLLIKYPKNEKFALVGEIRRSMFTTLEKILLINNNFDNTIKLKLVNELDAMIGLQKYFVRFSYKQKYINSSNYTEWSKRLTEIGKIIGGWYKYFLKGAGNEKN